MPFPRALLSILKNQFALLFTHSWSGEGAEKNRLIYAFPKGINANTKEPSLPYYLLISYFYIYWMIIMKATFATLSSIITFICDRTFLVVWIQKVCSKRIKTQVLFTKTEINNEWNIFFKIVLLAFSTLNPVSFLLAEASLTLFFWHCIKLYF